MGFELINYGVRGGATTPAVAVESRSSSPLHLSSGQMAAMLFPPSLDANREPDQLLRYHGVFFRRASLREVELWWSRQPSGFVPGVALIVSVWELCWT